MKKTVLILFCISFCSLLQGSNEIQENNDQLKVFKDDLKEFKLQVDELRKLIKNEKN